MQIQGTRVLILGGSGLVGMAIARQLLPFAPAALVISGLTREEAEGAVAELGGEASAEGVELVAEWGDLFVPDTLKERRRTEILSDPGARAALLDSLYGKIDEDAVAQSAFGTLLLRHQPEIILDCINTATVFAYQNVFASVASLREKASRGPVDADAVEQHLATLYLPQLIRHVQIALDAMRRVQTGLYLKIGTAGTGGMGLNVPFTHSEERPSRVLLAKASVAGAHTLLLFLMARTPGAPAVKEIKPTAAISWKRIGYGEVTRGGRPIKRVDATRALPLRQAFDGSTPDGDNWRETGETLRGVFLDAGENGLFSPSEFETLTALGLMEYITPEEIACDVLREIRGYPTGHDVVAALDASTSGPTYRAGVLRQSALGWMDQLEREHGVESVAYEMLGPPRLSKLLFEAAILARLTSGDLAAAAAIDAAQAARDAQALIENDADLRTRMLSIGIPVLLPDGAHLLRGAQVKVEPETDDPEEHDRLADNGWVDLRPANWERWRNRASEMLSSMRGSPGADRGSRRDIEPWEADGRMRPGVLAAWVFRYEDLGERIKR
jgi:NAD(P)-dependent dehydrogenase (short-subunit alcohol dehydrogenase family)